MSEYVYTLKVTSSAGGRPRVHVGKIYCENFHKAVEMALDEEGHDWEYKRSTRELIAVIKVSED